MKIELQLERLEAINAEIGEGLRSDNLEVIGGLLEERHSRINQLLSLDPSQFSAVFKEYGGQISGIQQEGDRLSRLIELKLQVLANELRKTRETKTLVNGYATGSQQLAAELRRTTDLSG